MSRDIEQPIENEEDLKIDKKAIEQTSLWSTDWTIETINAQILKGNIDLYPNFQRRNAWSEISRSKLIESLIIGMPIPQIILAEKKNDKGKFIVIDGKQRLLTIRHFLADNEDGVYVPFKLKGLPILKELNNKTYDEIKDNLIYSDYINQLENQTIRTVIIKGWTREEFLYTIFHRLNTGSLRLNPQELRKALHPGKFMELIDNYSADSNGIMRMLDIDEPDTRMRDVELCLRYFSYKYFIKDYTGNLKDFFDKTAESLNKTYMSNEYALKKDLENLETSIAATYDIFGENAFRKWSENGFEKKFNRAIYDIMVYYFSQPEILEKAKKNKNKIVAGFKELSEEDKKFVESFEFSTKTVENTFRRLNTWGKQLEATLKMPIKKPFYIDGKKGIK